MYDNQLVILSPISVILCKILIAVFTKSTKIDQLTSSNLNQIGLCVRRIQSRISYMTITIRCKSKRTAHKNRSTKTNTNQTLLAYECAWENMIFFERWKKFKNTRHILHHIQHTIGFPIKRIYITYTKELRSLTLSIAAAKQTLENNDMHHCYRQRYLVYLLYCVKFLFFFFMHIFFFSFC